ncbi:RNA ligase family protein [Streptomyces sp. ISL-36]|uniref:ATP-dependent DNA ligase n=1 Tax=Streptomyces sp. ISL-36 TaxID=2819182 RepID=UPI0027E59FEE|nr:RNA ligase family protein [Streptomyces sp. ISL-36]
MSTPQPLRPPLPIALASIVRTLPRGPGLAYEPKLDGIRMLLFRLDDGVVLQTRRNNIVTPNWPDLARAAQALPVGTVLDGEAVIWREGRMDFPAVLQCSSSAAARAAQLAAQRPASYGAFDILATEAGDVRSLPCERRRALLEQVLANVGPPLQAVLVTRDLDQAQLWHDLLPEAAGTEGLVIKRLTQSYPRREQRVWFKLRHTETSDAPVVGFTGRSDRPAALVLQLAGRIHPAVTAPLRPRYACSSPLCCPPSTSRYRPAPARRSTPACGPAWWPRSKRAPPGMPSCPGWFVCGPTSDLA